MELSLEAQFQLVTITNTIKGCHDVQKLQDMLIEVTRSNLAMQAYYKKLVIDEWKLGGTEGAHI